jgi:hypothetical protein
MVRDLYQNQVPLSFVNVGLSLAIILGFLGTSPENIQTINPKDLDFQMAIRYDLVAFRYNSLSSI